MTAKNENALDLVMRWTSEAVVAASQAGGRDIEDSAIEIVGSSRCKHLAVILVQHSRTVKCKGCGEKLDPFWLLTEYATNERVFRNSLVSARMDRDHLRRQVEELKKERSKLGAQVRRGKKRKDDLPG